MRYAYTSTSLKITSRSLPCQNYSSKIIATNLYSIPILTYRKACTTQVDEASNGEELLDNTEKQAESLLSNDDYVSETKNSISDDRDDVAESLSSPAEGNRKIYHRHQYAPCPAAATPTTNCCAISRQTATAPLPCAATSAAAHGITSASGLVSYQEDFTSDAAQDLGVHGAAAELIMQETFFGTAAEDVGILGNYAVKGIKDVQDGTRTAEEVLHTGGDVLRMELGKLCGTNRLCRCTYRSALCRDLLDQCG